MISNANSDSSTRTSDYSAFQQHPSPKRNEQRSDTAVLARNRTDYSSTNQAEP
jgi:hypothetical protein